VQIERLPVFFKQRDNYFFPAWTFVIPTTLMRLPVSFVESLVFTVITYFEIDLAPTAGRYYLVAEVSSLVHVLHLVCVRYDFSLTCPTAGFVPLSFDP